MDQLLARHTSLAIHRAEDGMEVMPDRIYLIPPRTEMSIEGGQLRLVEQRKDRSPPLVIDTFFVSLARDVGPRSIGIVLSGTGSDGSRGLRAIKEAGGLVLVQDESSAKFDGMPRAAIATGTADAILPPWEMGPKVRAFVLGALRPQVSSDAIPEPVQRILDSLLRKKGVDFSQYKDRTVLRRMQRRMNIAATDSFEDYFELLVESPTELDHLFQDLLINVTEFFRDEKAFEALTECLPRVAELTDNGVLRAWTAGCATGEEAYSIAMLLDELVHSSDKLSAFKIFATDVAPGPIAVASEGQYPFGIHDGVDARRLNNYFERTPDGYRITRGLRDRVVFAQHNITRDPPFTRMHIVTCRNLLIYMTPELQERVLHLLHFALVPGGLLFLGPSEVLGDLSHEFEEIDAKWRVFRKLRDIRLQIPEAPRRVHQAEASPMLATKLHATRRPMLDFDRICGAFLTEFSPTCLILDEEGTIVHTIGDPHAFLSLPAGHATLDIRRMLTPEARTAVTTAMHGARTRKETVTYVNVPFGQGGVAVQSDLTVKYLAPQGDAQHPLYLLLLGEPHAPTGISSPHDLEAESVDRLQHLERELQHTKENLQATIEELETTNEELQSTNEELQSTNEELHSVNEELYTVNAEHQSKIEELTELSNDMENLLRSIEVGTVFLDRELRIRNFTPQADEIISLMTTDIGRPIRHLAHELKGVELYDVAKEVVDTGRPIEREALDAAGVPRLLRVFPYSAGGEIQGAVITMIDVSRIREAQRSLAQSEQRFQELVERLDQAFWTTSADGSEVLYVSPLAEEIFGLPEHELRAGLKSWFDCVVPEERKAIRERFVQGLADGDLDLEFRIRNNGDERWIHAKGFPVHDADGRTTRVVGFARDVSSEKQQQRALEVLADELESKAHTDALTGLSNRRGLEAALTRELSRAKRGGHTISVALLDLDDFKGVNDSLGHTVGDLVLHGATERMHRVLRPTDVLARIGGDEFLALLPETRIAEGVRVAERLRLAIADSPITVSNEPLTLTASVGVAVVPHSVVSIEEVVDGTRQALSIGKKTGKNRVVAATDGQGRRLAHAEAAEPRLEELTVDGAIRPVCQPIRDLVSAGVYGFEMLSRGPDGPYAMPGEFLRLSLEKNMLNLVDLKCLRACVSSSTELPEAGPIHVNLFPSTLVDTPVERIVGLLDEAGGPERFCIELSEQLFLGAPIYLVDAVRGLRERGVRIAIDDVGYGRSSIEALVLLEPDVIKLAREFVREADGSETRRTGLERLVRASSTLSSTLVAEGVETEGERDLLIDLGVRYAQGFLWDHPCPPKEALA